MRCSQNETSFSWSYPDSSKRSLENNVLSRSGREFGIGKFGSVPVITEWYRIDPKEDVIACSKN
jgi:hypothetical protein